MLWEPTQQTQNSPVLLELYDFEDFNTKFKKALKHINNKTFHEIHGVEHNSLRHMVANNVLAAHLPLFRNKGIVLTTQIVFFGDPH